MTTAIHDREGLIQTIRTQYILNWNGIHGWDHWMTVWEAGKTIGVQVEADLRVVELFALLHDSCRRNDSHDPKHGPRAAEFARTLNGQLFTLDKPDLETLLLAIRDHTSGYVHEDPTISACWDADRLDLPRVGITPRLSYLGTEAARKTLLK